MNVYEHMIEILNALNTGKSVQYILPNSDIWQDVPVDSGLVPDFFENEYRIKPEPSYYRVGLFKNGDNYYIHAMNDKIGAEKTEKTDTSFVRWLTDWTEYETP